MSKTHEGKTQSRPGIEANANGAASNTPACASNAGNESPVGVAVVTEFWRCCPPARLPEPFENVDVGHILRERPDHVTDQLADLVARFGLPAVQAAGLVEPAADGAWTVAGRLGQPGQWMLAFRNAEGLPFLLVTDRETAPDLFEAVCFDGELRSQICSCRTLLLAPHVGDCALLRAAGLPAVPAHLAAHLDVPRWHDFQRWAKQLGTETTAQEQDDACSEFGPDLVLLEWSPLARKPTVSQSIRKVRERLAMLNESLPDAVSDACMLGASDRVVRAIRNALLIRDSKTFMNTVAGHACVVEPTEPDDANVVARARQNDRRPLLAYADLFATDPEQQYPVALRAHDHGRVDTAFESVRFSCHCRFVRRLPRGARGCPFGPRAGTVHDEKAVQLTKAEMAGLLRQPPARRFAALIALMAPSGKWARPAAEPAGTPFPVCVFAGQLLSGPAHVQLDAPFVTCMVPNRSTLVAAGDDYVGVGQVLHDPWTHEPVLWLETIDRRPPRHKVFAEVNRHAKGADDLTLPKPTPGSLDAQASRLIDTVAFAGSIHLDHGTRMLVLANLLSLSSARNIQLPAGHSLPGAVQVLVVARDADAATRDCRAVHTLIGLTDLQRPRRTDRADRQELVCSSSSVDSTTDVEAALCRINDPVARRRGASPKPLLDRARRHRLVMVIPQEPLCGTSASSKEALSDTFAHPVVDDFDLIVPYFKPVSILGDGLRVHWRPSISIPALRGLIAQAWMLDTRCPTTFDWRPGTWSVMRWIEARLQSSSDSAAAARATPLCATILRVAVSAAQLFPAERDDCVHVGPQYVRWAAGLLAQSYAFMLGESDPRTKLLRSVA
ncbi:MAG: hypothetical protein O7B26_07430 [Planctomycetota bacterium]|nr:hypothetical protein [Planctomycetota bacterium]